MTDKVYTCKNVKLIMKDREKLTSLKDKDFEDNLEDLVGWVTNLYRLYEVDPKEVITLHFPTDRFIGVMKSLNRDTDKFIEVFCETMESLLKAELQRRHIDIDKLHYGMGREKGIEYEYCHISKNDYINLLKKHKDKWYKIICVVPYKQIHRDTFFVQQSRLHEFFEESIYKCYDGKHRKIVHIESITTEKAKEEIEKIKNIIKKHGEEKFRTNEFLQTMKKNDA